MVEFQGLIDASTVHRRVVLSLKVRLCLQTCRCEFSAAFIAAKRTGSPVHHARSNSVPKNSLQRRAIPQSLDQYSAGYLCASSFRYCSVYARSEYDASPFSFDCGFYSGWSRLALLQRKEAIAAAQNGAPASPTVALSASPASAQARPTGHASSGRRRTPRPSHWSPR